MLRGLASHFARARMRARGEEQAAGRPETGRRGGRSGKGEQPAGWPPPGGKGRRSFKRGRVSHDGPENQAFQGQRQNEPGLAPVPRLGILQPQRKYPYLAFHPVGTRLLALEGLAGSDNPAPVGVAALGVHFKVVDGHGGSKRREKPFIHAPGHVLVSGFAASGIIQDVTVPFSAGVPGIHEIADKNQQMVRRGIADAAFTGALEGRIKCFVCDDFAYGEGNDKNAALCRHAHGLSRFSPFALFRPGTEVTPLPGWPRLEKEIPKVRFIA